MPKGVQTTTVSVEWIEEHLEELAREITGLEHEYDRAKEELDSGRYEERHRVVADELFSRIMEYDHKTAPALQANYILWWGRERIEELAKPQATVIRYTELCEELNRYRRELAEVQGDGAEKGL
jgi:hypothetical protein